VGQADLAGRGQGPAGLARLVSEQPAALGGRQQPSVDLVVVESAGGDQVVEVAGRLPQLAVAVADRGGRNPGQLLGVIVGCRQLRWVLAEYVDHDNGHRPHRAFGAGPPLGSAEPPVIPPAGRVARRDRLGGLIHEYAQVA
jgi:hypothetical protein